MEIMSFLFSKSNKLNIESEFNSFKNLELSTTNAFLNIHCYHFDIFLE